MIDVTTQRTAGSAHLAYTMAALTAAGGIAGYVKARSLPSVRHYGASNLFLTETDGQILIYYSLF